MKPNKIIIHHSLTKDSETVSWSAIRRYHKEELGWSDIGYHFGIEEINGSVEILFGRMPFKKGAHCRGHNAGSIGICVVGNFDNEKPSKEKWEKLKELIYFLSETYAISRIYSHNEFNDLKSCPGRYFDITQLRYETLT